MIVVFDCAPDVYRWVTDVEDVLTYPLVFPHVRRRELLLHQLLEPLGDALVVVDGTCRGRAGRGACCWCKAFLTGAPRSCRSAMHLEHLLMQIAIAASEGPTS